MIALSLVEWVESLIFRVEENELSLFLSFIFVAAMKYDDKK